MPTIHGNESHDALPRDPQLKRSRGEDSVPAPSHDATRVPQDVRQINGWGADLDPAKRPMVPMELPSDTTSLRGDVGARQEPRHRVFVSNEHPDLTPVFGESCPPKGLSGMIRSYAYEYGEGTNRHWMMLMLADRVDVLEHLFTGSIGRLSGDEGRQPEAGESAALRKNMMAAGAIAAAGLGAVLLVRSLRS